MKVALSVLILASLAGCAVPGPDVVHPYEAQRLSTIGDATVLSVRPVTIDGYQTGVGAGVGAVTGSVVAANAASYKNSGWAGLLGFVVGGVVGNAMERSATTQNGVELLLQMRNGERRSIVQPNGNEGWVVGEQVVLVTTAGRTRVTRAAQAQAQPVPIYPAPALAPQPAPVYPQSGPVPAYPPAGPVPTRS
jgi:outer membrane lipoprotein SlyB